MAILKLLKSRKFLIHLVLAVLMAVGIIWGILKFLNYYTLHGQTITVPDLSGLKVEEIEELMPEKKLKYEIVDSIFDSKRPRGTVLDQDPEAESQVKENRTIYLTMNAFNPPSVPMPRLIDKSLRSALIVLENNGLKTGDYQYIPDMCKDCVLKQQLNGKPIEEGEMVPKGARIELVLGMGISDESIRVPLLIELTMDSALTLLQSHFLNLGGENYDSTITTLEDSMNAKIYMQDPHYSPTSFLPLGSSVNLWFTLDESKIDTNQRINYVSDTTILNNTTDDPVH